jgi:hypothetical protein
MPLSLPELLERREASGDEESGVSCNFRARFLAAMKIAAKERAPSAATWRRLQLVPYPVSRRRRAAALQGASRIFMHSGGPTARDIFAQGC